MFLAYRAVRTRFDAHPKLFLEGLADYISLFHALLLILRRQGVVFSPETFCTKPPIYQCLCEIQSFIVHAQLLIFETLRTATFRSAPKVRDYSLLR